MKQSWQKPVLIAVALLTVIGLLWRWKSPQINPPVTQSASNTSQPAKYLPSSESQTERTDLVPPPAAAKFFLHEANRFITGATPFGVKAPVRPEEVKFVRTNQTGRIVYVETETHLFEFHGERLAFFFSRYDGTDTRREPTAMDRWYQASAPWTREEAIQETQAIMEKLGVKSAITREEYEPFNISVTKPDGQKVRATPFHTVRLYTANDAMVIEAEYRMSSSGPGRLVRWFNNVPN